MIPKCWINGIKGEVTTDVVVCNIPLLLGRNSMKSMDMILNFSTDHVIVGGIKETVSLKLSSSGHYLMPLNL